VGKYPRPCDNIAKQVMRPPLIITKRDEVGDVVEVSCRVKDSIGRRRAIRVTAHVPESDERVIFYERVLGQYIWKLAGKPHFPCIASA
jgi:hypothetical protein